MKKNMFLKIAIPIAMVVIVAGIWVSQNAKDPNQSSTQASSSEANQEVKGDGEEGFALHISSVDLPTLVENELPIIIDFGADECVPCKEMAPVLETLNTEMQGKAIVQFVDVWKSPEAAQDFPVQVVPTQIFVNADGTPYYPSEEVASAIQLTMYSNNESGEHVYTAHQGGLTEDQMRMILADMGVE